MSRPVILITGCSSGIGRCCAEGMLKRGWHVVDVDLRKLSGERDVSWMALCIWIDRGPCGYWVASHWLRQFAFESGADAVAFKLKWA
jgi:NAD(P)-dependent dehydrogenase (short-subunit alcohol dehydrogenase family)